MDLLGSGPSPTRSGSSGASESIYAASSEGQTHGSVERLERFPTEPPSEEPRRSH
jgi:hypothetical protein